jgi:hypothetical protein
MRFIKLLAIAITLGPLIFFIPGTFNHLNTLKKGVLINAVIFKKNQKIPGKVYFEYKWRNTVFYKDVDEETYQKKSVGDTMQFLHIIEEDNSTFEYPHISKWNYYVEIPSWLLISCLGIIVFINAEKVWIYVKGDLSHINRRKTSNK